MRQEKQFFLDSIQEHIEKAEGVVILKYHRLTANSANDFRGGAAKLGAHITMVPKRVFVKGAAQAGLTLDRQDLEGHIGLVFADRDPLEVAKFVVKYGEEAEKVVEILGGRFEGKMYNAADMVKLSQLPSLPEMRSQFLSVLEAPLSQTLATMEAILCSVIHCLENKAQQSGQQESQPESEQDGESQQ
ncbi:MAG: 50S ribosomal protein L10 [Chlamydiales bacterium]|nr:50S ribosomal protein L10 [Chlamydiales bacterium]